MRSRVLCCLLGLMALAPSAVRADEIAAVNMDGGWVGINGWAWYVGYSNASLGYTNEAAAQEFVVSESGTLTTISATVDRFSGGSPLLISVYTAVNRRPGVLLGYVAVPESQVNGFNVNGTPLNTFDLSSAGIPLVSGQNYIVTFTVAVPGAVRYRAFLNAPNINSFGIPSMYSKDRGATWTTSPAVTPEIGLVIRVASPPPPPPLEVAIDVIPGSTDNYVNLKSRKFQLLEVAVLGDNGFDVSEVVPGSIFLGDPTLTDSGAGYPVAPTSVATGDVNGDGVSDLRLQFDVAEMKVFGAIDGSSVVLRLDADLGNGGTIYGFDVVTSTKAKGGGKKK